MFITDAILLEIQSLMFHHQHQVNDMVKIILRIAERQSATQLMRLATIRSNLSGNASLRKISKHIREDLPITRIERISRNLHIVCYGMIVLLIALFDSLRMREKPF